MNLGKNYFNVIKTLLSLALISLAFAVVHTGYAIGQNPRGVPSGTVAMWNESVPVPVGWCALDGSDPECGPDLRGLFIIGAHSDELPFKAPVRETPWITGPAGDHTPLLYLDNGVVGGPDHGDKLTTGAHAYYPQHGVKHYPSTLYRHEPVKAHNHGQTLPPHFKMLFIRKI